MLASQQSGFRTALRAELLKRTKENPRYSLRNFARALGVSPAMLSNVLTGRRRLSIESAARISDELDMRPAQATSFMRSVVASHLHQTPKTPRPSTSGAATLDRVQMKELSKDTFQAISDWYHYAILEMTFLKKKALDPRTISKELECSYIEAVDALERLKRLGLLEEKQGKFQKTSAHFTSGSDFSSNALRRLHLQLLEKAKQSLVRDPVQKRDCTSMTMAISSAKLPEAKKRIEAFRRDLCAFLEDGQRDRVYALTINLFPLSHAKETR